MIWSLLVLAAVAFVGFPTVLYLFLEHLPWYATVAFLIWVAVCVVTMLLMKVEAGGIKKIRMMPSVVATAAFTVLFCYAVGDAEIVFDDKTTGVLTVLSPALGLFVLYLFVRAIKKLRIQIKKIGIECGNEEIDRKIDAERGQLTPLEAVLKGQNSVGHFVALMEMCGEDMSQLRSDERVESIMEVYAQVQHGKEQIRQLKSQKKKV
ncbi:MAG TPA: hypothetical protein IAD01_04905 [Candidatus Faeciplasma gallinarum]|uniref:Uncharacterized protein n=1 Tax=Candidatus Faeciplasma gallinarum TaxID=2840799 RepID=A0A9D1EPK2_9FIRM|nr:hypothetical protein [Candidatus Faeciplasma gallinarum]